MLSIPTFAELAGDVEARCIEASRIYRASHHAPGDEAPSARRALIGATDVAAREGALRWLEKVIADKLAIHTMMEGPRDGSSAAWDAEAAGMLAVVFAPLEGVLEASKMARDPDWPVLPEIWLALPNPVTRGDATRVLRDMWWRSMLTEQTAAREKPGAFLASVGIVQAHVDALLAEALASSALAAGARTTNATNGTDKPVTLPTVNGGVTLAPGETVQVESVGEVQAVLPGDATARAHLPDPSNWPPPPPNITAERAMLPGHTPAPPTAEELRRALMYLGSCQAGGAQGAAAMAERLDASRSSWGNWANGRTASPRITFTQAQALRAECDRLTGELQAAAEVFGRIRP